MGATATPTRSKCREHSPEFAAKRDGRTDDHATCCCISHKLPGSQDFTDGVAVKGDKIEFKFSVDMGELVYSGTIQDDGTIKGTVKIADNDATFTGRRADK